MFDGRGGKRCRVGLCLGMLAALGAAGCRCAGRYGERPQPSRQVAERPYPVVYATIPPTIDGKLDDDVWQRAVPWKTFYEYDQINRPVDLATAYMAWDRDNLYFAVAIRDQDIYLLYKEDEAILCTADVVELFIKPSEQKLDLYEFEFNAWGAIWDVHYVSRGGGWHDRFSAYDSGAVVAATYEGTVNNWTDEDTGWTVEVAIPMKAFSDPVPEGPRPGDRWRFNVAGYDFSVYRESLLLYSNCDGNTKGFAEYELYPELEFLPPD